MPTLYQITVLCVNMLLCQNCSWCPWVHINLLLPKWQGLIFNLSYLYSLINIAFSSLFGHIILIFMVTWSWLFQFLLTHNAWHLLLSNLISLISPHLQLRETLSLNVKPFRLPFYSQWCIFIFRQTVKHWDAYSTDLLFPASMRAIQLILIRKMAV